MLGLNIHEVESVQWDKSLPYCKTLVVVTSTGTVRVALFPLTATVAPAPPPSENDDLPTSCAA